MNMNLCTAHLAAAAAVAQAAEQVGLQSEGSRFDPQLQRHKVHFVSLL